MSEYTNQNADQDANPASTGAARADEPALSDEMLEAVTGGVWDGTEGGCTPTVRDFFKIPGPVE